jgi:hypothetical protein
MIPGPGALLMKKIISLLMLIIPPDPLVDARHRLCVGETFHIFSDHPYGFFEINGESPEAFLDLM